MIRSSSFPYLVAKVLGDSSIMLRSASTPSLPTFPDESPLGQSSTQTNNAISRSFAPAPPPASSSVTTPAQPLMASPTVPSTPLSSSIYTSAAILDPFNRSQSFPAVPAYNPSFFLPPPAMSRPTSLPVLPPPPSLSRDPPLSDFSKPPWSSATASTSAPPLPSLNAAATAAVAASALGASPVFGPSLSLSVSPYGLSSSDLAGMDPALRHRLGHEMMMRMGQELTQRMAVMAALTQTGICAGTGTGTGTGAGIWNRDGQATGRQSAEKRTRFCKEAGKSGNELEQDVQQETVSLEGRVLEATVRKLGAEGMNSGIDANDAPEASLSELPSDHVTCTNRSSLQGHDGRTSGSLAGRGLSPIPRAAVTAAEGAVAGGKGVSHSSSTWLPHAHAHPQAYMAAMFQPSSLWANHASNPYGVLNPFQVTTRPSWAGPSHLPLPVSFPWIPAGNGRVQEHPDPDGRVQAFPLASSVEALSQAAATTLATGSGAVKEVCSFNRSTPATRSLQEVNVVADVKGKENDVSREHAKRLHRLGDGGVGAAGMDEVETAQLHIGSGSGLDVSEAAGNPVVAGSSADQLDGQEQRCEEIDEEAVAAAATLQLLDAPTAVLSGLHDRMKARSSICPDARVDHGGAADTEAGPASDCSVEVPSGMQPIPACLIGVPSRTSPESSDLSPNPIALCNA